MDDETLVIEAVLREVLAELRKQTCTLEEIGNLLDRCEPVYIGPNGNG